MTGRSTFRILEVGPDFMSLSAKFRKSLARSWYLRFKTIHPEHENIDGIVRKIAPRLIVLRETWDLEFDGIIVVPKKVIRGTRDGRFERCLNRILREDGIRKWLKIPAWLDACETLPDVIVALMKRDIWPGVEILSGRKKDSVFYLGPITRTTDEGFYLYCYDADGTWEKEYEIDYDEVYKLQFDSRYCNRFNRYMREHVRVPPKLRRASRAIRRANS